MRSVQVSITVVVVSIIMITMGNAQSGIFRQTHDRGFGGAEVADPISPNRFWQVTEKVMNRLVRPGPKGAPSPSLATEWSANPTATEWTFKLRQGVKFHDGSAFDAADVVYSFDRIKDPKIDSPVMKVLAVVKRVEAVNPATVKLTLFSGHADLPILLMDYRIRMIPNGSGETIAKSGIGTGPFILSKLDPEGTTVLKANSDYWEGPPGVETIEIISMPDIQARVQALLSGQIDMLRNVSARQLALFRNNPKFKVQKVATGDWIGIAFRVDTEPFTEPRVRKALRIVSDRQAMVDLVLGTEGGIVACDHPVWTNDLYRAPFDCPPQIDEAKRLLAEVGYSEGIEIDVYASDLRPHWINFVEVYQQQAAQAGIRVNLVKVAADGYWSDVWMKKAAAVTMWGQRPADQILNEAYQSESSWNETNWKNPIFDRKLAEARQQLDLGKRKALYHELQVMLFEEGGSFIPFHLNKIVVTTSRVRGLEPVFDDSVRYHLVQVSD